MGRPKKNQEQENGQEVVSNENLASEIKPKDNTKQKALELARASIEKEFGKGSVMNLKSYKDDQPLRHISSGSIALDIILGKGGFTFGRVVEIVGAESAGKSTLALTITGRAQELGLSVAYIDKENDIDSDYAQGLGVNLETIEFSQPNTGEEALSIAEKWINSGAMDIVIIDSAAALNPSADLLKTLSENAKMAGRASLLTRFFERNDSAINKNKVLVIIINQLRENLNPYGGGPTSPGGRALKHAASYRITIAPFEKIVGENGEIIGNRIKAKTAKNKLNSPFKEATYDLLFGIGIDKARDLVDVAVEVGVVEKTGSWFTYGEERFQGLPGAREFFKDKAKFEEVKAKVLALVGPEFGPEGKEIEV